MMNVYPDLKQMLGRLKVMTGEGKEKVNKICGKLK